MSEDIDIEDLLPHRDGMLLLDKFLGAGEDWIRTQLKVRSDTLFSDGSTVPAWIGIEYMAQTISAFSGIQAKRLGQPIKLGFLLGSRRFHSNCAQLNCGTLLQVHAQEAIRDSNGMAAFECTVTGENVEQHAMLSVYEPSNPQAFLDASQ